MKISSLLIAVALLAIGCGKGSSFPESYEAIQISRRSGGYAFLPDPGMVLEGSMAFDSGVFSGTRAVASQAGGDACLDPNASTCMVQESFSPIQLSAGQLDELQELIAAVPAKECDWDEKLSCDWRLATTITVDGSVVNDLCCGELNEDFSVAFQALGSYLDGLAAGTE